MTAVLGLTGKKYSGKNTAADQLGSEWVQISFAQTLREMLSDLNPIIHGNYGDVTKTFRWDDAMVDGYDQAKRNPEVRRLLQVMGTEVIRARDPNFWVRMLANRVKHMAQEGDVKRFVVTDVRFDNEAQWILQKTNGSVVRVVRPETEDGDTHSSEAGVDAAYIYDTVYNTGTIEELKGHMHSLVEQRWRND